MNIRILAASIALGLTAAANAQSNVDFAHRFAFGENIGFTNWRNANFGTQGVRLHPGFLSGFAFGENVGFINLGDATPTNGAAYSNASGLDFGVNRDQTTGLLSGFAYGENIGWVNFSGGALASPPRPARYDAIATRLRGFAWGENVGWINLDDANVFVSFTFCACDWNQDNVVNSQDFFDFLTAFFTGTADFNTDGLTNSQDFFDFLVCFFSGCF